MLLFGRKAASLSFLGFRTVGIRTLRRFCDDGHGREGGSSPSSLERSNLGESNASGGDSDDGSRHFGSFSEDVHNKNSANSYEGFDLGVSNVEDENCVDHGRDDGQFPNDHGSFYLDVATAGQTVENDDGTINCGRECSPRQRFLEGVRLEADQVFQIVQQDGLGFDFRSELEAMELKISSFLVREVLIRILRSINGANKQRSARLAYKFLTWTGQQEGYKHTMNHYNLALKIFAECREIRAMWRLVDTLIQDGLSVTARMFNILLCASGEAGLRRRLVEKFLMSKSFNYRPFKHSYNAILHALVSIDQYRLIEWVYQQMKLDGYAPDVLTYNILLRAKYVLNKLDEFDGLLAEMGEVGIAPDLHTYNLLLHVLGKGDKPLAALNLLNYMEEVGCRPRVIHYTSLIDGLSRAGNLEASCYFFEEMSKKGCEADVVCYTVMITSYLSAGDVEMAEGMFGEMIMKGHLPNVYTYNSMIQGLCDADKFGEACSMLKDMESRGCTPNFLLYSRLVRRLHNAKKFTEANNIIADMLEKGRYVHLASRFMGYKRL